MMPDPFRDLMNLQERMRRLFEESLKTATGKGGSPLQSWNPPVDVYETGPEVVVEVELPQVEKEQIEIQVESGSLVLSGRRELPEGQERSYHQRERHYGAFHRRFPLPSYVDGEGVQARYHDGVLTVRIPKKQQTASRHIPID